ncbi:penicillin-binding protein 2 [Candidatus Saccharibacteria bacterium]|nr:penicillin-binding protein 2 [Candidatus Saccharibacteria bacterium]MCL1962800.1 penicillin-binding protein 2 [Candidatus Saccharibacteria bacterium]
MATQKISRTGVVTVGLFLVLAVFAVKLFSIQIIDHDKYVSVAEQMQTSKFTINPERGQIYTRDQNGELTPLVLNQTVYTIFADPSQVKNPGKIRDVIKKNVPDKMIESNLTDKKLNNKENQYLVLARQVTRDQVKKIQEEDLAGLGFQPTTQRAYPEGNLAAQILGFVNTDGEGQYGVEGFFDDELTGKPGLLQSVTDVRRIPLMIGTDDVSIPAQNGADYILTIDRSIQSQAEVILKNGLERAGTKSGSIIVMNPQNGKILSMANYPTYNPAEFSEVVDITNFQNRTTSYAFEPGSVMKTLTTGMALDAGVITPNTIYHNTGCVQIDDAQICNASRQVDGRDMTATQILQWSLNTGVVWELQQIGNGDITKQARQTMFEYFANRYRFSQKTGIEQAGEARSSLFSPDDVQGGRVRYANMTFGQGMAVTMVQFTAAFSAAINGGTYYQPTLIDGVVDHKGKEKTLEPNILAQNIISEKSSRELKEMIYQARQDNQPGKDKGYYIGSKTGTAQIYDDATGKYALNRTTGTAIGFTADKDKVPQYVIMVRVDDYPEEGAYAGSRAAQPIFDELNNYIIQYRGFSK